MQYKFIKWIPPEEKKEDDEDDFDLDNSDGQFKLLGLIINEHISDNKNDPQLEKFMKENNFEEAVTKRRAKLDSADEVWETIQSEAGENADLILSVLKE
jgi:hypothetical protein